VTQIRRRTHKADCAQHLHGPITAFFPLVPLCLTIPPNPDALALTNSLFSSIKSALVFTTMMGTPATLCVNVPGHSGGTVPFSLLDIRRKELGGGFGMVLEVCLPYKRHGQYCGREKPGRDGRTAFAVFLTDNLERARPVP
jgi:hypothetical protein